MTLITQQLINRFQDVGEQSQTDNPLVIAKFFNPCGRGTWYATKFDHDTKICYGYVTGLYANEWGFFSIDELESIRLPFGQSIERDVHFKQIRFKDLMKKLN